MVVRASVSVGCNIQFNMSGLDVPALSKGVIAEKSETVGRCWYPTAETRMGMNENEEKFIMVCKLLHCCLLCCLLFERISTTLYYSVGHECPKQSSPDHNFSRSIAIGVFLLYIILRFILVHGMEELCPSYSDLSPSWWNTH